LKEIISVFRIPYPMTNKTPLQKILKGILHTEDENKHSHEKMGMTKSQRTDN
jgi:hypothetical protein